MAQQDNQARADGRFIGGLFEPDLGVALPLLGGGLPAFAVRDRSGTALPLLALEVAAHDPPRPEPLQALAGASIAHLTLPLQHGVARWPDGQAGQFVICARPPGGPIEVDAGWDEAVLLRDVLRPVAAALAALRERGLTHRAIRPDNVFRATTGGGAVTLGGAGWAASAGSRQPAAMEPLALGACLPAGRGGGVPADDVYALGVLLVTLLGGALPLAGFSARDITFQKLDQGSFKALTAGLRLPPTLGDLLHGMLADDPEHRPLPAALADPEIARVRRLATRPPRRADRPLMVGRVPAFTTRSLAYALAAEPAAAARVLRDGSATGWLQRGLGDLIAAGALDAVAPRGAPPATDWRDDAFLLMRAVAALDPGAPLCWRGHLLWPDGVGPALAAAAEDDLALAGELQAMVEADPVPAWLEARGQHPSPGHPMLLPRLHRARFGSQTAAAVLPRLCYALNPLLACRSPLLARAKVLATADLLPALELLARGGDGRPDLPLDLHMATFIAARLDRLIDPNLAVALPDPDGADLAAPALAQLRVLARIQGARGNKVPQLAAWLAMRAEAALTALRSIPERADRRRAVQEAAARGALGPLLDLLDDPDFASRDATRAEAAQGTLARIDVELANLDPGQSRRLRRAQVMGREVAAALGVIALSGAVLLVLLQ